MVDRRCASRQQQNGYQYVPSPLLPHEYRIGERRYSLISYFRHN